MLSPEHEPAFVVIDVLEAAALEFEDSAVWYEARTRGLGERFLAELREAFDLIEEMPLTGSPWLLPGIPTGTRHVPLHTFPHSVVYITDPRVVVIAVAHGGGNPGQPPRTYVCIPFNCTSHDCSCTASYGGDTYCAPQDCKQTPSGQVTAYCGQI